MADLVNIPALVWKILNITPQLLSQYRTLQDQLLYLIFIPNIIFLLFIYWFATSASLGHKGFRNLIAIAAYVTLVLSGWYGRLVPMFLVWWWIVLGLGIFLFLISAVFKPGKSREMLMLGHAAGEAVTGKILEKREAGKRIKDIDNALHAVGLDPNKPLTSQPEFNILDKDGKGRAMDLIKEREALRRKAKEWF